MSTRFLAGLLLVGLPSLAASADQRAPELPSMAAVRQEIKLNSMERIRIDMDIRSVFSDGMEYDLRDSSNRIDMNVRRDPSGRGYRFSGDADGRYLTGQVDAQGDGSRYQIWGGGLHMDMRRYGNDRYEISGYVDEKDGSKFVTVTLRREGSPGYFSIFENGFDGYVSRFGSDARLSGQMDLERFGKKSLALVGVFIAVIESQLNRPPQ